MTLKDIMDYSRQLLRDTNKTIFTESAILNSINEGIDRIRSIPELKHMKKLDSPNEEPEYLPEQYHVLLGLFSASRCMFQDEDVQRATMLMNEFEAKMFELKDAIQNGDIIITDKDGNELDGDGFIEYVKNDYFVARGEF